MAKSPQPAEQAKTPTQPDDQDRQTANARTLEDVSAAAGLLDEFEVPTQNEQGEPMPLSQRVAYLIELAAERVLQRAELPYQSALAERLKLDRLEIESRITGLNQELAEIEEDLAIRQHALAAARRQILAIDAWLVQHPEEQS